VKDPTNQARIVANERRIEELTAQLIAKNERRIAELTAQLNELQQCKGAVAQPEPAAPLTVESAEASRPAAEPPSPGPAGKEGPAVKVSRLVTADLSRFLPRNRKTAASTLPLDASSAVKALIERALEQMRAGSIMGVIDHALDLLAIGAIATEGGELCARAGLTLLASLPASASADGKWGETLAEGVTPSFVISDGGGLRPALDRLLQTAAFGQAISEHFTQREVGPFAPLLASELAAAAKAAGHSFLEDVSRALGEGAVWGSQDVSQKLLESLALSATGNKSAAARVSRLLDGVKRQPRGHYGTNLRGVDWAEAGVLAFASGIARRKAGGIRSLHVQVPESVRGSGGFALASGASEIELALLVTNPHAVGCSMAEVSLPKYRNPWLREDLVRCLGPMPPQAKNLIRLLLPFSTEVECPGSLVLSCDIFYSEVGASETKQQSEKLIIPLRSAGSVIIDDYRGGDSRPIPLEGAALDRSPKSVRDALAGIRRSLTGTGAAAVVTGRRRRGKTSLLVTLARDPEIRSKYCVVEDSIEHRPFESYLSVLQHLGGLLDRATSMLGIDAKSVRALLLQAPSGWEQVQQWLSETSASLPKQVHILLLLDEFQRWLSALRTEERRDLLGILRGLTKNRPADSRLLVSVVVAGLSNLRDFMQCSLDFQTAFDTYELRQFNASETEALVRSNTTIDFDLRAVERIRQLSGGNPFLINLLGNDLAELLRTERRTYCFPADVESVVASQLDRGEDSKVWKYLQYLLRLDEEDSGAQIPEFGSVVALAKTLTQGASMRAYAGLQEIAEYVEAAGVQCNHDTLQDHLTRAVRNELVEPVGQRYGITSGWLREWLSVMGNLVPIKPADDLDLVLNRYRITQTLPSGGQAQVYEAVDTTLTRRPVILKVYPVGQSDDRSRAFEREASALCAIQHRNVVTCLDYGRDERRGDVLVLEPIRGTTLAHLLEHKPATTQSLIGVKGDLEIQVAFLEELAGAVQACHAAGVIHKDLAPSNVVVQSSMGMWHPVLIDFGIASRAEEVRAGATTGAYTPGYVPPERHAGEPRREPADIYCLGVIAYELLTGAKPFPGDPVEAVQRQRKNDITAIVEHRPTAPERLAVLIESMLMADPLSRPDAFTVTKSLRPALEPCEWAEYVKAGRDEFDRGNIAKAHERLEKAIVSAQDGDMRGEDFGKVLDDFITVASECGKLLDAGPTLMDTMCRAAVLNGSTSFWSQTAHTVISSLLNLPTLDHEANTTLAATIIRLCDCTGNNGPIPALGQSIPSLLSKVVAHPGLWHLRDRVYLFADEYAKREIVPPEIVGHWCLACSREIRKSSSNYSECQLWLQRAEGFGLQATPEFIAERVGLEQFLSTPGAEKLPGRAAKQDSPSDAVGAKEQGHLKVSKITAWVQRLQSLYPWVQGVRRVTADSGLQLYPTRVLGLDNLPRHIKSIPNDVSPDRIIPAVLDSSYTVGERVLRINIILPAGTTAPERETAIARLREDHSLFPEN
jgi:serine/threonine protein kinase